MNQKCLKICILQTGEPLHCDDNEFRPMRAISLANYLVRDGHDVDVISSSFFHQKKAHRTNSYKLIRISDNLKIHLIPSTGYKKNISIFRLLDHFILAVNLKKFLTSKKFVKPDVAFIGFPPIESSYIMAIYLKKNNIPFLVDLKDMWPSLFINKFPTSLQFFAKILFYPYIYMTKKTIMYSNSITSMSNGFLKWFLEYASRTRSSYDKVFPLTSPISQSVCKNNINHNWLKKIGIKQNDKVFTFVGSFMSVFDFTDIILCAKKNPDIKFILAGEGSYKESLLKKSENLNNIIFPGWLVMDEIITLASVSKGALVPYKNIDNYTYNIPNKVVDALSLGLPIISTLGGEFKDFLYHNNIGFTYSNSEQLSSILHQICDEECNYYEMSENCKSLYKKEFQYETVYSNFAKFIPKLLVK